VYTLQQSINFAQAFIEYSPLSAGTGFEPAVSSANAIRSMIMNAPFTWPWNRAEDSSTPTVAGTQDYTINLTDFSYLEKVSLTDASGNVWEVKDVYNTNALPMISSVTAQRQRPVSCAVKSYIPGTSVSIRFSGVPEAIYTITLTYQKLPIAFGPYVISSVANSSGSNAAYTGIFNSSSFPAGATATITGFVVNAGNNGSFSVISCTPTVLTVANSVAVAESASASVFNGNWFPIPDSFIDIFNTLFLGEAFQSVDDTRGQQYRQRGALTLLSKAEGLTSMQRSAFLQQFLARDAQALDAQIRTQQGNQARGV
jgi:hypothetical protein